MSCQRRERSLLPGTFKDADTRALLNVVRDGYRPFQVVACVAPSPEDSQVTLLKDRSLVEGRPAAFVCRSFTCQTPVAEPDALRKQLVQR